jgi:mono/diheme cytochrome c family protein
VKTICVVFVLALAVGTAAALEKGTVKTIEMPRVATDIKDGEGKSVTVGSCSVCHSLDYIVMQPPFTRDQWAAVVDKMRKVYKAPIDDAQAATIKEYLARQYGK